jgi:hypothetical protein
LLFRLGELCLHLRQLRVLDGQSTPTFPSYRGRRSRRDQLIRQFCGRILDAKLWVFSWCSLDVDLRDEVLANRLVDFQVFLPMKVICHLFS